MSQVKLDYFMGRKVRIRFEPYGASAGMGTAFRVEAIMDGCGLVLLRPLRFDLSEDESAGPFWVSPDDVHTVEEVEG